MPTRMRATVAVAAVLISAAACSGGGAELSPKDFRAGVCRDSATAVINVQDALQELEDDPDAPGQPAAALKESQKELQVNRDQADGQLRDRISDLTNAIGFLRISIDAETFKPAQTEDASAALDRLVTACSPA